MDAAKRERLRQKIREGLIAGAVIPPPPAAPKETGCRHCKTKGTVGARFKSGALRCYFCDLEERLDLELVLAESDPRAGRYYEEHRAEIREWQILKAAQDKAERLEAGVDIVKNLPPPEVVRAQTINDAIARRVEALEKQKVKVPETPAPESKPAAAK